MITTIVYPFSRHEIATATVKSNTVNRYKFDNIEILNNKKIKGIAFYKQANLAIDANGAVNAATALVLTKAFLTLKTKRGTEDINAIPAYMISAGLEQPDKYFPLKDLVIDWENSYFTVPALAMNNNEVLLLGVFFDDEICK